MNALAREWVSTDKGAGRIKEETVLEVTSLTQEGTEPSPSFRYSPMQVLRFPLITDLWERKGLIFLLAKQRKCYLIH